MCRHSGQHLVWDAGVRVRVKIPRVKICFLALIHVAIGTCQELHNSLSLSFPICHCG